jgi:hypothetical protein
MRGNGLNRPPEESMRDSTLWQRSRETDAPADEADRFLELAGFADGRLDADDQERLAEWIGRSSTAIGDIAAARDLARAFDSLPPPPDEIISRACALVPPRPEAVVIPFPAQLRFASRGVAHWASLAAAVAVAAWLGFSLGMDASRSLTAASGGSADLSLHELLDPTVGLALDPTEGPQS